MDWLADWAWFLPPYPPELNRIEILRKKVEYEGLPWAAYSCFDILRTALQDILANQGRKYQINHGWVLTIKRHNYSRIETG